MLLPFRIAPSQEVDNVRSERTGRRKSIIFPCYSLLHTMPGKISLEIAMLVHLIWLILVSLLTHFPNSEFDTYLRLFRLANIIARCCKEIT
jgi:hypothetical protein